MNSCEDSEEKTKIRKIQNQELIVVLVYKPVTINTKEAKEVIKF